MSIPGRRKTTLINLVIQGLLVVYTITSGILLVPLYLAHIPADLYGAWQASGNVLAWMSAIDPGLSTILLQRVASAYGAGDKQGISAWIASGMCLTLVVAGVIFAAGMGASLGLGVWMHLPASVDVEALQEAFRWAVLGPTLMVISFSLATASQGLQSSVGFGVITVVALTTRLLLVVYMVQAGYGLLGIAIPIVAMGAVNLIAHTVYLRMRLRKEDIPWTFSLSRLRELGGLMGMTSLSRIATVLGANMDLFLVARILGPENVNVLRFTRTAPDTSRMLVERPISAMQPSLAHLLGSPERGNGRALVLRLLRLVLWLLALLVGGFVAFNAYFVRLWVGGQFFAGDVVNLMLVASFLFTTTFSALGALCFTAGAIREASVVGAAQVAVYLPTVWIGAHYFGIVGVVGASILSVLVTQGVYLPRVLARRYSLDRDDIRGLLRAGLAGATAAMVMTVAARVAFEPSGWIDFAGSGLCSASLYIALLWLLSAQARIEMGAAIGVLRRRLSRSG